ncbi:hypothetical protein PENTCL1PPCAC_7885, partial [Pristionchus entomophagus]
QGYDFFKDIEASFEYDRRQITLFFHNREPHPDAHLDDADYEEFIANYKLTINMSAIRKFGLDQVTLKNGQIRRSLILHIDHSPQIQVKLRNVDNDGKAHGIGQPDQSSNGHSPQMTTPGRTNGYSQRRELKFGLFEHRQFICRGRYPGEISHRMALHESKILILEFDDEGIKEILEPPSSQVDHLIFDILSRLRHKTEKAVEFTAYDQVEMLEGEIRVYDDDGRYQFKKVHPYDVDTDVDNHVYKLIQDASIRLVDRSGNNQVIPRFHNTQHILLRAFKLRALLEGILM